MEEKLKFLKKVKLWIINEYFFWKRRVEKNLYKSYQRLKNNEKKSLFILGLVSLGFIYLDVIQKTSIDDERF